ncbi:MAG TPA: PadR family transcriptional regulator [Lachnospiraceae bacterium]|jgi:DNA-binding PadR family transcriptional regulator|nr:PadR family transcriptional regulator [Lachnospiraceae bacterium]
MMMNHEPLTESYFYILLCLYHEPLHGYGIMQETLRLSANRVKIGSGTMYGAVSNMMKKGWLNETMTLGPEEKNKRMYEMTADGRQVLEAEIKRLHELVDNADKVTNATK